MAVRVRVGVAAATEQHIAGQGHLTVASQVGVQAVDPCAHTHGQTSVACSTLHHTGVEDAHAHAAAARVVDPRAWCAYVDQPILQWQLRVIG